MHRPYIPLGVDQQGRVADGQRAPAPAEAATHFCGDDDEPLPLPWILARWAVVLTACCWGAYLLTTAGPRIADALAPLFR